MSEKNTKDSLHYIKSKIQDMSHSTKPLHRVITSLAKKLLKRLDDENQDKILKVLDKYLKVATLLSQLSRKWTFTIHWAFTVCNPKINDESNPAYSPVYIEHQCKLPPDCFGEMSALENGQGNLIHHGDKLVGDDRFTNIANFGTAFNEKGEVVKTDEKGHPVRDGFFGWVASLIDGLINRVIQNQKRDRHAEAHMIAHTRDYDVDERESKPKHKEAHIQGVLDLPMLMSRYQIMQALGFNFDDFVEAFKWMDENIQDTDDLIKRMETFLDSLLGSIKNFNIPEHFNASLQYLVHQSKQAVKDQKAAYSTSEVLSWLPDECGQTYETIAGVNDNQLVAEGIHAEIIQILQSPFNRAHHTMEKYVGESKLFNIEMLEQLHKLGTKKVGSTTLSKKSMNNIFNQIMIWLRERKIEFTDWQLLLHASFEDADADYLLGNINFMKRVSAVIESEKQVIIDDPSFQRNMLTVAVLAQTGGIGKTRLANAMSVAIDKGRKPFSVVAKSDGITFDPFQGYENQSSVVMDEVSPASFTWESFKDSLDPHKMPAVSSRYHNALPWNVKYCFLTNVFAHGITDFVNDLLHYAKGVSKLGYLDKDYQDWKLILNNVSAGKSYVAQLSQVLRRIPFVINIAATPNGQGTMITVSRINYQPGSGPVSHYDYVHTKRSQHTFRTVINENLTDDDMTKLAKKVISMMKELESSAKKAFQAHPGKLLDEIDGFVGEKCDFHVRYKQNGDPYLVDSNSPEEASYGESVKKTVEPRYNLITRLSNTEMSTWDGKGKNVNSQINQLDAFLQGYEVPVEHDGYNNIMTIKLTKEGLDYYHKNGTKFWRMLNSTSKIGENSKLVTVQTNESISNFRIK